MVIEQQGIVATSQALASQAGACANLSAQTFRVRGYFQQIAETASKSKR